MGKNNDRAQLIFNPFTINFYLNDVIISQINHRNLFNFEEQSEPIELIPDAAPTENQVESDVNIPEASPTENKAGHTENEDVLTKYEANSAPEGSSEEKDQHKSEEHTEEQPEKEPEVTTDPIVPQTTTPNPFPWTEHFKEHRDTRPYGQNSLSLDIDFPGFSHAYGIPEHTDGFLLKDTDNGDPYRLYNLDVFEYELDSRMALYGAVPFLWALNENHTVGVFWHNPSETWIDVHYTDRKSQSFFNLPRWFSKSVDRYTNTRWMSESGVLDVFIMLGKTPQDISQAYSHLTGTTPLPPMFALAYHQCRWNYNDEKDVLSLDEKFDHHDIPVDVIWLDIEHTNGKRYFTWDKTKFPSPGDMVDKLNTKGRKMVTVVDPHIKEDTNWPLYKTGLDNGYYVQTADKTTFIGWCWPGSSAWPDFIDPVVRQWWAEQFLTYEPVRVDNMFSWNDMGEPSVFSGPEISMHKDALHVGNREHRDVHNIYGLQIHRATWDGQLLRSGGRERPFVLTRAFFAGSQRTSAVWTGDNAASWGHLQASIPMTLSLSLTGITLCGADVGGFFGNPDAELITRWYQTAAFQPFFRAHAHLDTKRREPWLLPEEYLRVTRQAILERYKLLPYWYTTFARAEANGEPVLRPIWYNFRHVTSLYDTETTFMIGEAMLVHPVTAQGAQSVDVPLPPGVWYQYPTLKKFVGGEQYRIPVDLSTIPVFYRGGWIVPRRERIRRSSWLMRNDPFTLFIFIDPAVNQSQGYLYDDDYHSVDRGSIPQMFRIVYINNWNPLNQQVAGGRLRLHRLPIPGANTAVPPSADQTKQLPHIERIVVVGLADALERVTYRPDHGEQRAIDFIQTPSNVADDRYLSVEGGQSVAVIQNTQLPMSNDWELHLVTGAESRGEL